MATVFIGRSLKLALFAALCAAGILHSDQASAGPDARTLGQVRSWMYQIQDLDEPGAVEALERSDYDMLVIEPGHNFSDYPYPADEYALRLSRKPDGTDRVLLAYVDIGQAEEWRDYWGEGWQAPSGGERGSPAFLLTVDPDGWAGNYPVAYWEAEWQELWLGPDGIVAELAALGFDGVYLDWVEAHDDDHVRAVALKDGVEPALEMIAFIERIGAAGRAVDPGFLVVPQNAPYLIDAAPARYLRAIDALAVEDTWFHGAGDADWNDPAAGDLRDRHDGDYATDARLRQYERYQSAGLPVFSVDYAIDRDNVDLVYEQALAAGLIPLVTRVSLSRMTETPPPWLDRPRLWE